MTSILDTLEPGQKELLEQFQVRSMLKDRCESTELIFLLLLTHYALGHYTVQRLGSLHWTT